MIFALSLKLQELLKMAVDKQQSPAVVAFLPALLLQLKLLTAHNLSLPNQCSADRTILFHRSTFSAKFCMFLQKGSLHQLVFVLQECFCRPSHLCPARISWHNEAQGLNLKLSINPCLRMSSQGWQLSHTELSACCTKLKGFLVPRCKQPGRGFSCQPLGVLLFLQHLLHHSSRLLLQLF